MLVPCTVKIHGLPGHHKAAAYVSVDDRGRLTVVPSAYDAVAWEEIKTALLK